MTEMPTPQAERPFNSREGLEMPESRFGDDHVARIETIEIATPDYAEDSLEISTVRPVELRRVARPALEAMVRLEAFA